LLANNESAVPPYVIDDRSVNVPASDSLGPRVNHGAVRDYRHARGRPADVNDRRGASIVYFDACAQAGGQAIFYHAHSANTGLFGRIQ